MKNIRIPFQDWGIIAILDGRKTVTRRLVTSLRGFGRVTEFGRSDSAGYAWTFRDRRMLWNDIPDARLMECCPYGQHGDTMVGIQTYAIIPGDDFEDVPPRVIYRADGVELPHGLRWRTPRYMRGDDARIRRPIMQISVERIQEITAEDVQSEGVQIPADPTGCPPGKVRPVVQVPNPYGLPTKEKPWTDEDYWRCAFACEWESIHGPGAWSRNDWVWRIEFGGNE